MPRRLLWDLVSVGPADHIVKVAALVNGVEIGKRTKVTFSPLGAEDTNVAVAHQGLTQHVDAVN